MCIKCTKTDIFLGKKFKVGSPEWITALKDPDVMMMCPQLLEIKLDA